MSISYKDLQIFQFSRQLALEIHQMTLTLPKFELYEEGSQIRRSSKAITKNIVEGFGRRRYKQDFFRYLNVAHTECDETQLHLNFLYETKSLNDNELYFRLQNDYQKLGRMLFAFLTSVQKKHISDK